MSHRRIILCFGITTCGKTYWAKQLHNYYSQREKNGVFWVDIDAVRVQYWGADAQLDDEDHLFKNELLRMEVKRQFIIEHAKLVIVSAVMLTHARHHVPFSQMAHSLGASVKSILFTCTLEASKRRLEIRKSQKQLLESIRDLKGFEYCVSLFENPTHSLYPALEVDTSVCSPQADETRLRQILSFLEAK